MAARFNTPLRYPGGKGKLTSYFEEVILSNGLKGGTYIEPYAGGAGTAINLLIHDAVSNIVINDADQAIFYFWKAVTENTEELTEMVKNAEISVDEWNNQREIFFGKSGSILEQGFSTLYLNRTNRSGILAGGLIGGKDQTGPYKMDARFNKANLVKRIKAIGERSEQIEVLSMDANYMLSGCMDKYDVDTTLVYIDPPYFDKGSLLYMNHYVEEDHKELANTIKTLKHKWILSYDNVNAIKDIYSWSKPLEFSMYYSAHSHFLGKELFYICDDLNVPGEVSVRKKPSRNVQTHIV